MKGEQSFIRRNHVLAVIQSLQYKGPSRFIPTYKFNYYVDIRIIEHPLGVITQNSRFQRYPRSVVISRSTTHAS